MNDGALIAAARAHDPDAMAAIYDRDAPIALALARRITDDRHLADDAVHDAFLAFWDQAQNVDSGTDIRAWICDRVRRIALARAVHRPPGAPPGSDPRAAAPLLEALPAAERIALEAAYFGGRTYQEIAADQGVSAPHVLAWLRQALARMTPGESLGVVRTSPAASRRRLLLIEPNPEVAATVCEFLGDLGFDVSVHPAVQAAWPDPTQWNVVVVNVDGERSTGVMAALRTLRSAPQTSDALVVCGGVAGEVPDAAWLAANRVNAFPGAVDMAHLGDVLRKS